MTDNDAATFIKSIVSEDAISQPAIDRLGGQRTQELLVCALSLAVDRRFPEGTTQEDIAGYAASLRSRYPRAAEDIKPIAVEALIRTTLGEEGLLDGISNEDLVPLEFLVVHDILSAADLEPAMLDNFVNEVVAMADAT